ncbi:hypothetical protein RF11_13107 [Thelohanellus kitauei]|uniref:Uncharacterized protein n=1 Tax=Thelohanellus kitauei TaxID=669202 RepID=A0A0C2MVZ0_THEKT|nr:hypothetical protein RF11_13107 [Thelohanellus kitauei]
MIDPTRGRDAMGTQCVSVRAFIKIDQGHIDSYTNRNVKTYRDKGTAVAGKIGCHKPSTSNEELKSKLVKAINHDSTISIDAIIEKLHLLVHTTTTHPLEEEREYNQSRSDKR